MLTKLVCVTVLVLFCASQSSGYSCQLNAANCGSHCAWETTTIWTNCNNAYPQDATYDAILNTTGNFVVNASVGLTAGNVIVGNGNTGIQTLSINGGPSSVVGLVIRKAGVVDANLGDSIALTGGAITLQSGGKLIWRSGDTTSSSFINVQAGGIVEITGTAKTLGRTLQSNGTLTIEDGTVLTLTGTNKFISYGSLNISGTVQILTSSTGQFLSYGTATINTQSTVTLDAQSQFNQSLVLSTGTLLVKRDAIFTQLSVGAQAILDVYGGEVRMTTTTIDGTLNWSGGHLLLTGTGGLTVNANAFANLTTTSGIIDVSANSGFHNLGMTTVSGSGITVAGYFHNNNDLVVDAPFAVRLFTFTGGKISGLESMTTSTVFNWTAGTINSPLAATGQIAISTTDVKVVDTTTLTLHGSAAVPVALSGTTTMAGGASIVNAASSVLSASSATVAKCTECDFETGTLVNAGQLYGTLSLNTIDFVNSGNIGGTYSSYTAPTKITVDGNCEFTSTSKLYLDVYSSDTKSSISCTKNFTAGGTVSVRLRKSFVADSNTKVTLLSYTGEQLLFGAFDETSIDLADWDNLGTCTSYNFAQDTSKNAWILTFGGCTVVTPPPVHTTSARTGTVLVVILVVVIVAFAIGLFAWCKKKYKKRPWDRLKTSRL